MGLEPGDALAAFIERVDAAEGVFDDLGNAEESLSDAIFGDLKDRRLGRVDYFFRRFALVRRSRHGRAAGVNERAQKGFVSDDVDVLRNAWAARQPVGERGD